MEGKFSRYMSLWKRTDFSKISSHFYDRLNNDRKSKGHWQQRSVAVDFYDFTST